MRASNKQTSECGRDRNSTEELIKQLENRLDRLTGQPAEDMNEEEIENILNLLDTLKPLPGGKTFNPEEAFGRLEKDYLDNPEKLEQASEEADRAELIATLREKTENIEPKHTATKKHRRFRVLKNVGIAAAIMILVFSGLNLATYATAKKGLFDLIINRKNTMSNMYVGDGDMGMNYEVHDKEVYTSWDEVPDEAKKGILLPGYLPEGMELEEIEIFGNKPHRVELRYMNNNEEYIDISVRQFETEVIRDQITNPDAEYVDYKTDGNIEYYVYKNGEENIIIYIMEQNIYYIYSDCSLEEMKKIINSF